jgi:hypothetical protein
MFQQAVMLLIIIPVITLFALNLEEIKNHLIEVFTREFITLAFAVPLVILSKYYFVRPAISLMEEEAYDDPVRVRQAIRSTSLQPFAEALAEFVGWAIISWFCLALPMMMNGQMSVEVAVYMAFFLSMVGASTAAFMFLAVENSLVPFYMKCTMKGVLDGNVRFMKMSLSGKLLGTILFTAIPPIGYILSTVCLGTYIGMDLATFQVGFVFIILQTILMTFFNGFLLIKGFKLSVIGLSLIHISEPTRPY